MKPKTQVLQLSPATVGSAFAGVAAVSVLGSRWVASKADELGAQVKARFGSLLCSPFAIPLMVPCSQTDVSRLSSPPPAS